VNGRFMWESGDAEGGGVGGSETARQPHNFQRTLPTGLGGLTVFSSDAHVLPREDASRCCAVV
jgi:hypothetical protein